MISQQEFTSLISLHVLNSPVYEIIFQIHVQILLWIHGNENKFKTSGSTIQIHQLNHGLTYLNAHNNKVWCSSHIYIYIYIYQFIYHFVCHSIWYDLYVWFHFIICKFIYESGGYKDSRFYFKKRQVPALLKKQIDLDISVCKWQTLCLSIKN